MQNRSRLKTAVALICSAALALGSTAAFAQHGGGGHAGGGGGAHFGGGGGGAHFGGGGGGAHVAGGGYRGGYGGYHGGYGYGGYHGGYRGGYGWRGGYGYGWRGGYYGGWGLGLGLGLGLYFATLPYYYSTYYWGGIPYYYADNTYYTYDGNAGQYVTVAPPAGLANEVSPQAPAGAGTDVMAYPKNGQSDEQQKQDKYECHHWATTQSGFDPTQGAAPAASATKRSDYMRAQVACLEGRGYSVQ